MITQKDWEPSNKSYISKDFRTVYTEILDIAKKLSEKWEPTSSNESDPGIVLLKLLAFVADKNNYNIDKNVLECFMPSATQETSMRKLCDMMGYNMKYYRSATTEVSLLYTADLQGEGVSYVTLNALDYSVTDEDNNITYVLTDNVTFTNDTKSTTFRVKAIEGKINTLTVSDSDYIQLVNLDDNNRIYFSESMIAENGIYIQNREEIGNYWKLVDNLNTIESGNKVFRLGYDSSRNLPYIQFPLDIATLIKDGLLIRYITTSGSAGNVRANYLTRLTSIPSEIDENYLTITNQNAALNGADVETINEAYNSFKKTVGTFDTLVTCRDYANKIYNLMGSNNQPFVSNVQVADRRTDINYMDKVVTYSNYGITTKYEENGEDITPFDLCLYPLNPIYSAYTLASYRNSFKPLFDTTAIQYAIEDYKTISHDYKTLKSDIDLNVIYKKSFESEPAELEAVDYYTRAEVGGEYIYTIVHNPVLADWDSYYQVDYYTIASYPDIYCFKNYYKLSANITTTAKVDIFERQAILDNINTALYMNFNARQVDYGYEIPYDMIKEVILEADARIKSVDLYEPELSTYAMYANVGATGTKYFGITEDAPFHEAAFEVPLFTESDDVEIVKAAEDAYLDIVVKNITAGNISLFSYNNDFEYSYGQSISNNASTSGHYQTLNSPLYNNVMKIGTEAIINHVDFYSQPYELKDNEVVQLLAPNLTTELTYSYMISFRFEGGSEDEYIAANTEYQLTGEEKLIFVYTNSNNIEQVDTYTAGTIIKPNFDLPKFVKAYTSTSDRWSKERRVEGVDKLFYTLDSSEEISKRKLVKAAIKSVAPCYWFTTKDDNYIDFKLEPGYPKTVDDVTTYVYTYMLKENEYFMHADLSYTSLEILGSGTKLILYTTEPIQEKDWKITPDNTNNNITIQSINDYGIAAFASEDMWRIKRFNKDYFIETQEMQILTLTEGDKFQWTGKTRDATGQEVDPEIINNTDQIVCDINTFSYYLGDDTETKLDGINIINADDETSWVIHSRLDVDSDNSNGQVLHDNQYFYLTCYDEESQEGIEYKITRDADKITKIYFNTTLQATGGDDIDVKVTYIDSTTLQTKVRYDVKALVSDYEEVTYEYDIEEGQIYKLEKNRDNIYTLQYVVNETPIKNISTTGLNLPILSLKGYSQLLMVYVEFDRFDNVTDDVVLSSYSTTNGVQALRLFNHGDDFATSIHLNRGINIVEIRSDRAVKRLNIKINDINTSNSFLYLTDIATILGFNPVLNRELAEAEDQAPWEEFTAKILERLQEKTDFYYINPIDNSKLIDLDNLATPDAFWDYNNIANKFTIAEIDFANSDIRIAKASQL